MNYWSNLAKTYNTKLLYEKETVTVNTTPVQKAQREIHWSNPLGNVSLKYFHHEHSLSHNNSTYSKLHIKLKLNPNLEFKLNRVDFLEKFYFKIWYRKKIEIINNFILKSNDLIRAKRILDSSHFNKLYIESIELAKINDYFNLTITTREDFVRKQNAELYIEFLLKLGTQINST